MAEAGGADEPARRTITMYRDGFVVDDGPFRRLDDPANAEFLRSLAQGRTPRELVGEGDVTVGLMDKRNQDYVEEFRTFSGTGNTLGSANSGGVLDPATLSAPGAVDESRPTTSIAVRLMGGGRRVVRINLDAPVMDLAAHLNDSSGPFTLVAGFPPRPLTDFCSSIEDAGLKGAQVMQKEAA
jgi:UBX domain-containing protein 1